VVLFQRKVEVRVQIEARLVWEVARDPQSNAWIGVCRPLNLNAVGDTWAEFQECANEAIALLFTELLKRGELGDFLRSHGWMPTTPLPPRDARVQWDVPYQTQMRAAAEELVPA
jgi:hypothetical protein